MYKNYLIELQKKERKKRKQEKIQKEIDERIHREQLRQSAHLKRFENADEL